MTQDLLHQSVKGPPGSPVAASSAVAAETYVYEIRQVDGVYCAEIAPGVNIPIKTEGGVLLGQQGTVGDGWEPKTIYTGLAPVFLLEWRHKNGATGTWYLNTELKCVGGSHREPSDEVGALLRQSFVPLMLGLWNGLLCAAQPRLDDRARAFRHVNHHTISFLAGLCAPLLPAEIPITGFNQLRKDKPSILVFTGDRLVSISSAFLIRSFEESLIGSVVDEFKQGAFTWPSPIDGRTLTTDSILALSLTAFAARFVDPVHNLVFYVISGGDKCRPVGVFFPASWQMFGPDEHRLKALLPKFGRMLAEHLCVNGDVLEGYLTAPSRTLTYVIHGHHHGHLLFEDLAGLDDLIHAMPVKDLPEVFMRMPGEFSEAGEVYGKIEDLFPLFSDRVRRFPGWPTLLRNAYAGRHSLVRAAPQYVSRRLADRVIEVNAGGPEMEPERQRLQSLNSKKWPIVLMDLRIENRTFVDLGGFCAKLAEFLLRETGGAAMVLSGHTGSYVSPMDIGAKKTPIQAQTEIFNALVDKFRGEPIELIDCIGKGMRRVVFWSHHAHFFLAPWGASLVNYRWIGNMPGLVIANSFNLRHGRGPGTDIYNSTDHMENPTPMAFLAEEFVHDDPAASPLSAYEHPGQAPETFFNFHVDEPAVFEEVRRMLRDFGPSGGGSRPAQ